MDVLCKYAINWHRTAYKSRFTDKVQNNKSLIIIIIIVKLTDNFDFCARINNITGLKH